MGFKEIALITTQTVISNLPKILQVIKVQTFLHTVFFFSEFME